MLPTLAFLALDEFVYNALVFLASGFGSDDAAKTLNTDTTVIFFNFWGLVWSLFWGFGLATQVRVGYHLGANNPRMAKMAAGIGAVCTVAVTVVLTAVVYASKDELPKIFSSDNTVIETVADTIWIFCFSMSLGVLALIACSILEGLSLQLSLAVVCGIASWVVVLPVAYVLVFKSFLGTKGIWVASAAGEFTRLALGCIVIALSNWTTIAERAQQISEVAPSTLEEDEDRSDDEYNPGEGAPINGGFDNIINAGKDH